MAGTLLQKLEGHLARIYNLRPDLEHQQEEQGRQYERNECRLYWSFAHRSRLRLCLRD